MNTIRVPKAAKPKTRLNEDQVLARLAAKHPAPAWAFLPQVRNATGYSGRTSRTADALAMGLWPSRGLELHGFEVKSYRADWLTELKKPEKAEEIARFCHKWWIVAGSDDVVQEAEVPPSWGLMVPFGRGLTIVKQAQLMDAQPPTYPFLASLLRKVTELSVPLASIEKTMEERYEAGKEAEKWQAQTVRKNYEELQENVTDFEEASGLQIRRYGGSKALGATVKMVDGLTPDIIARKLKYGRNIVNEVVESIDKALAEYAACQEESDVSQV